MYKQVCLSLISMLSSRGHEEINCYYSKKNKTCKYKSYWYLTDKPLELKDVSDQTYDTK